VQLSQSWQATHNLRLNRMPLQATSGAASYDAFGGGVAAVPNYIEDVFSTYLYTGNGSTQTITNGIDLSTKGGLVWLKNRSVVQLNFLTDTAVGANQYLTSNSTSASTTGSGLYLTSFNTNGFSIGTSPNANTNNYASWTFRKQPKFFDVVTYTGDGTAGRQIPHNLGSVPGCIIVKCTDNAVGWAVYHRSLGATKYMTLNLTDAEATNPNFWNDTEPTSTAFTVAGTFPTNRSGYTYVAYLFAHNAGGFGLTGTDNVISCGSYTGTGSTGNTVTLGYEPQWILVKDSTNTYSWQIQDVMRGMSQTNANILYPDSASAEVAINPAIVPTATGFRLNTTNVTLNNSGDTYIYIAIRRGPMKVPTDGTKIFSPNATTASGGTPITTGFTIDAQIQAYRSGASPNNSRMMSRLTGVNSPQLATSLPYLLTSSTAAEASAIYTDAWDNTGFEVSAALGGGDAVYWNFRRAPSFFDEVCYTGTGSATTVTHNLGVTPELMIVKKRSLAAAWIVYSSALGGTKGLQLNGTNAQITDSTYWNNTDPTSSVFTVGTSAGTNSTSGNTFVAYLFASCTGVSKVGSYTGTGTTKQIDCGFTGGARFVLIKRTDSTGDWYVWDTARGIVAGNDPYLLLNSTAAEVTTTDYIDTYSAGFEISSTAPAAINASGGTFIFLAIA
jgi:hypothetical protein